MPQAWSEHGRAGEDGQLIRNVDASLEAVEEILNALLDISRLDAGALKPEFSTFAVDDLFKVLEVEFGPIAEEKGLDLRFVPCGRSVKSDRRLIRRVLQNFISNAIKYTRNGKVLIGCRLKGEEVSIQVHDSGMGIPHEKRELIFQEFERLEDATRAAQGLGLGLSIVQRIMNILGHGMDLKSVPGKGSRFAVNLPLSHVAAPSDATRQSVKSSAADLSGLIVLCVDNEENILDGMRILLTGWGCKVHTAHDTASTVDLLKSIPEQPHIVLADYHLDQENGLDLIAELRASFNRDLPAALITADRSRVLREDARKKGVFVLNKPVKPAALRSLLAQSRLQLQAASVETRRWQFCWPYFGISRTLRRLY